MNKSLSTWPALSVAETAVVHFLGKEHRPLADSFATSGIDRFEGLDYTLLDSGEPLISGVETWAQGRIIERIEIESTVLVVIRIQSYSVAESHEPLIYHDRQYFHLSGGAAGAERHS